MDDLLGVPLRDLGGLLIRDRAAIDAAEARWLELLAAFDRRGGWALDGHGTAVSWLVHKCGLSRPAAKERLRVARELEHRPVLAAALAAGEVSFSKVRALTRILDADDEADRAFLAAAAKGTAADMEILVRHYRLNKQQHTRPKDRWERCGMRLTRRFAGTATIEVVVPTEDAERIMAIVDTSVRATNSADTAESTGPVDTAESRTWIQRRADTLVDLLEAGLTHLGDDHDLDPEAATVHVMVDYDTLVERAGGSADLDGGIPLSGDAARRLACDAGLVRIITRGASEILDVGRKTRQWTTAQRRAIRSRFRGRCAFPACEYRITQIHHTNPWNDHGETNLDCGVPLCRYHHHLVHEGGWTATYNPAQRAAIFTGPNHQHLTAHAPGPLKLAA